MQFLARAALFVAATFGAAALAHAQAPDIAPQDLVIQAHNVPASQTVPALAFAAPAEIVQTVGQAPADLNFDSLAEAVAAQEAPADMSSELNCLAVGIYYEAKSEPVAGQLAVAEVILNRATSGRFPRSVCGVLTQRGQFSFVRGGKVPVPPANAQWLKALAVAQVAQKNLWDSPVPSALFFHARFVKPSWNLARVGTVGNHIFYR